MWTTTSSTGWQPCSPQRHFDCTFDKCGWFGEDVLWLAPDRDQEFRDLTNGVAAGSDYPPYGGEHDDVIPHLTVGDSRRYS